MEELSGKTLLDALTDSLTVAQLAERLNVAPRLVLHGLSDLRTKGYVRRFVDPTGLPIARWARV